MSNELQYKNLLLKQKELIEHKNNIYKSQSKHLDFIKYCWQKTEDDPFIIGYHTYKICKVIDDAIRKFEKGESVFIRIKIHHRSGKQFSHSTLVPTPTGFKKHGDLKVNDSVYNKNGNEVKILALSNESLCNRVIHFSDKTKIETHENHKWIVEKRSNHKKNIILSTREIEKNIKIPNSGRFAYNYHINNMKPYSGNNCVNIDSYLLGVWLGDGKSSDVVICNPKFDIEHINEIKKRGIVHGKVWEHKITGCQYRTFLNQRKKFTDYNLLNNKHIPEQYFFASEKDRCDLLGGIIDTDGTVDNDGRVIISTSNERLKNDLLTLISSLGYVPHWHKNKDRNKSNRRDTWKIFSTKQNYCVDFYPDNKYFGYLKRKRKPIVRKRIPRRAIIKIEKITGSMGRCIKVEGGNYLVTDRFIPTHNSDIVSRYLPAHFMALFPDKEIMSVSYSASLAQQFSRFGRRVVDSKKFSQLFPYIKLSSDKKAASDWEVEKNGKKTTGRVYSSGLLSGLTGSGYHLGILDDYIRGRSGAESLVQRDTMWDAFTNDFMTRRATNSITIILATQFHEDDIHGRIEIRNDDKHELYEEEFPKFELLSFPAIIAESDYKDNNDFREWKTINGKEKKYLFEERYSREWYKGQYATLGSYASSAMMDCSPVSKTGGILDCTNIKFHESDIKFPLDLQFIRVWDFAHTEQKKTNKDPDFTGGTLLAFRKIGYNKDLNLPIIDLWIKDYFQTRETAVKRDNSILRTMSLDGQGVQQIIETSLDSIDGFYYLQDRCKNVARVSSLNIGKKNKLTRCEPLIPVFEIGDVHVLEAEWNKVWLDGIRSFDGSGKTHDEMIDNITAGYEFQVVRGTIKKLRVKIG